MAVSIVPKFTKKEISQMLEKKRKSIHRAILLNMQRIGEEFVKRARNNKTYKDRTANLRSSIGYVVLYNGQQLYQSFQEFPPAEEQKGKAGVSNGVEKAKDLVEDAKRRFPKGFVLIGVAGMEYAAAVEANGMDVITNASIAAEADLRAAVKRITKKTGR
jgi:hypothetical protein